MRLIGNAKDLDMEIISGRLDDDFSDLVFNSKKTVKD